MKIYQTIDELTFEELANDYEELFFREQNIRFKQYRGYNDQLEIYVTDLTNALKPGKEVTQYIFAGDMWEVLFFTYDEPVSAVLEKLYRQEVRNIEYRARTLKALRVFSPFAKIKPITPPKKWTIPHVWKAILSGQITKGQTDMRLTDDYAYDAATNFGKGEIDVLSFAKKIIEDPSGWWVSVDKETDTKIQLSVNCHSFDFKTLIFLKAEKPSNVIELEGQATKKQLWALHCITKQDTRNWKITKKEASELISKAKNGVNIVELCRQYI